MRDFVYHRPGSIDEACQLAAADGAMLLAGGQTLLRDMKRGLQAPASLVDITGVPMMDTRTAQYLLEAISAVRLLGAQVILTGVRPAIAQTLVHLGIDLSSVATRPSLEAGLRLGLDMLDLQVVHRDGKR